MPNVDVRIRRARGLDDYLACVALQKEVWGYTESDDIAAQPMLMIGDRYGGSVLIAQNEAGRYTGFAFAMAAWKSGMKPFWWSHMTAVVKEYRNRGIGLALKLRQREEALASGIDLIEWTFDPLQALNAHFNFHKLGVIVREYEENVYGYTSSALHLGLPTDRFVAEWHLNPFPQPRHVRKPDDVLVEIPADVHALKLEDLEAARNWQNRLRTTARKLFHEGYVAKDFLKDDLSYLFTK